MKIIAVEESKIRILISIAEMQVNAAAGFHGWQALSAVLRSRQLEP
jgi:hypothetical protein